MGVLSGLDSLGLGSLEKMDIFPSEKKKIKDRQAAEAHKVEEKDLIYSKSFTCPVCGSVFPSKVMKAGRTKLLGTDADLRARYEGIDSLKYEVLLCPVCGYAALSRYFPKLTSAQAKLIREKVSRKVRIHRYSDEIYSYEQAIERYKLSLACAVVKHAKSSEKAYICLKSGWLLRGYQESLLKDGKKREDPFLTELAGQEDEYLQNAYKGFSEARQSESFPICGMDENTMDYLLAVLAMRFGEYETASRLVSGILTSRSANVRMKDKARDLKEEIRAHLKKK